MSRKIAVGILEKEGSVTLHCNGNSMRPMFKPGDSLHIKKVPHSKLRVGDAVFCRIKGSLQVHKVTAIDDSRWQISNNHGFVNGWIGNSAIYGLCVKTEDKVLVTEEELDKR
jgi:signal peptidase I